MFGGHINRSNFLSEIIPVSTQGLQELPNDNYKIYIAQYTEVAIVQSAQ